MKRDRLRWFPPATTLLLAWGALAFGAEYPWAYAPLLVFCTTVGLLALGAVRGRREERTVVLALALAFCAGALQLVPLPERVLTLVSPARFAHDFDALHAAATMAAPAAEPVAGPSLHAISIAPSRTLLALAFLAALSIFFLACARALSVVRASILARRLVVLGVVVALVAIAQEASGSLRVYGLWFPRKAWQPAAPFINENHLAGWLVMAFSMTAGYLCGGLARSRRDSGGPLRNWQDSLVRLSSRDANEPVLVGFAALVMMVAVFFTGSVSGMACLVAASWALAFLALRGKRRVGRASARATGRTAARTAARATGRTSVRAAGRATTRAPRRFVWIPVVLALAPLAAAVWAGLDAVGEETAETMSTALVAEGRVGMWEDTLRTIGDFPLAGVGLNSYGVAMLAYQTHDQRMHVVEAHNDYLQLAAEGGVLLVLPAAFALFVLVRATRRRFRENLDDTRTWWLRAGAVTGLCALALQSLVDFSLQMPGNAVLIVLLLAVAVHRPAVRRRRR